MHEFAADGIQARTEVLIPIQYKGRVLDCGFRADVIVENELLLELKAVERLLPVHDAQVLTYLKLTGLRVGLLLNFNAAPLKNGLRRFVK
jgi:GxxExxY protein